MKLISLLLVSLLLFFGCAEMPVNAPDSSISINDYPVYRSTKVTLTASDNARIVGNHFEHPNAERAVVLVHKLNSDKSEYTKFASELVELRYSAIAIDMRGHGESILRNNETLNWQEFGEHEFNKIKEDIGAAVQFLEGKGFSKEQISIVGASIGSNSALNYASGNSRIRSTVLLSPGLEYRGVKTEPAARLYKNPVLIVASSEDTYSFTSSQSLNNLLIDSEFIQLQNAGHGVEMMSKDKTLSSNIKNWLNDH